MGEVLKTYIAQPVSNAVSWLVDALLTGGNISKDNPALIKTKEKLNELHKIDVQ